MKKLLIGSSVGAVVLFIWSFLAWAILPIHQHAFMYNPAMSSVLQTLVDSNVSSGSFVYPMADNRNVSGFDAKFQEESQKVAEANTGKPAVVVYYKKEGYLMDFTTILKGLLFNFIAVFSACLILLPGFKNTDSFFGRWWLTLLIGVVISAAGPLINYNWMGSPWDFTVEMILDILINWSVVGLWFAFYFKNKAA
jgi:hypothetical protein